MNTIKIWLLASRPKTLFASISPLIMGLAMAYSDKFDWLVAAVTIASSIFIQVGTNFANDYFDFKQGADTEDRQGPTRATQAGLVSPGAMKFAFIFTFLLAFLCGVYLAFVGGWPIIVIGVLSLIFGVLYTAGPYALAYTGLGDIFVLIFFGPVSVFGSYYLQTGELTATLPWVIGLSPGFIAMAILIVNNLRDIETDARANKRTMAVRFGKKFTQVEYLVSVLLALAIPAACYYYYFPEKSLYIFLYLACILPLAVGVNKVFRFKHPPELNATLAMTSLGLLVFSIGFSVGWLLE